VTFLHQWFLVGLAAALVPLFLHVVQTRRIRKVPFSTLFFLKMIHRQRSLRIKVSRLLLLLARIALALLITLVFAQPYFTSPSLAFLNPGPRLVGILWDNSGASRATDGRQTVLELARARLSGFVGSLTSKDSLVVVSTSPAPRIVYRGDPSRFSVSTAPEATFAGGDRERALEILGEAFRATPSSETLLAIFSDFRKSVWKEQTARVAKGSRTLLFPARFGVYVNWGITRADVAPTVSAVGEPVMAKVSLRFYSSGAQSPTTLKVIIDGQVVDTKTMAASSEPIHSQIAISNLREGIHRVTFRLSPDSLDLDDSREVVVRVLPHRQVLLVNGKKRASPSQDEGFFLRKVLGTTASPRRGILAREVYELPGEDLRGFQAVVLTGVKTVPGPLAVRLSGYVEAGGTLLVFLGDSVDPVSYNAQLMKWFGLELSRRVESSGAVRVAERVTGVLEPILDQPYWQAVSVERYWLCLRKTKVEGLLTPLSVADSSPYLVTLSKGIGTAVLLNGSSGLESGDLPLHPIFPILVSESIKLATGAPLEQFATGGRVILPLAPGEMDGVLSIEAPGGRSTPLKPTRVGSTLGVVYDETHQPGIYNFVRRSRDGARQTAFVIAPPPVESDLTPLSSTDLEEWWPKATVVDGDERAPGAARAGRVVSRVSLVDAMLFLALLIVLAELYLVWDLERQILAGSAGAPGGSGAGGQGEGRPSSTRPDSPESHRAEGRA
jgi:hypothetical protein